ncbi:MAG: cytochrome c [Pyrinomonadaceae bacterium]
MTILRSLLIIALSGLILACGQAVDTNAGRNAAPTSSATPAAMPSADAMAQGRKLYTDNCAGCHREDGTGGKITIEGKTIDPDDLTSAKIRGFTDDKIHGYIYNGLEDDGMPAFKDKLAEAEIREVVRYLRAEIQDQPLAEPTRRTDGVD